MLKTLNNRSQWLYSKERRDWFAGQLCACSDLIGISESVHYQRCFQGFFIALHNPQFINNLTVFSLFTELRGNTDKTLKSHDLNQCACISEAIGTVCLGFFNSLVHVAQLLVEMVHLHYPQIISLMNYNDSLIISSKMYNTFKIPNPKTFC